MSISGNQPIRLTSGDVYTKAIGSDLRVFLNGEEVDPSLVYSLDEGAGWIDFLILKPGSGTRIRRFEGHVDPDTERFIPQLRRATGQVEVRLKDEASEAAREIYAGLRDGTLRKKFDILRGALKKSAAEAERDEDLRVLEEHRAEAARIAKCSPKN
jgi:hypothetical protein